MKLPCPELPQLHLQPGKLLVTQEPQWVITLLGSCVAVTMFNARYHLSGICHAMLPKPRGEGTAHPRAVDCFRYVSHAIPALSEPFFRLGLSPDEVEVKMFGGGNVIDMGGEPGEDPSIGEANVALARQLLESANFRIRAQSVGGSRGCKIVFNTRSGQVLHKRLSQGARRS